MHYLTLAKTAGKRGGVAQKTRMRVTLLHNRSAGSEDHAEHAIEASIRRAGHEIVDVVSKLDELLTTLDERRPDLIVIAGGDGTVSRAACALAGRHLPLAILPLGTANNTALSLGVKGTMDALVAGWARGTHRRFDLATVIEGDDLAPFSEAVGWGVFPDVIAETEEMATPEEREDTLARDRGSFRARIEEAKPDHYEIEVDGVTFAGDYLLVEVVNIPYIGPQLELSPSSNPSDGRIELVLAGEPERAALLELAASGAFAEGAGLPTRRATHVTVRTAARRYHRDGKLIELTRPASEWVVTIEPAVVEYLLSGG
jgi:diacylglycerol kinase (ATP)